MTRTRSRTTVLLGRWAPPLALMAVIFALSAQPDLSTGLGTWDLIGRKLVHAAEYGLLWLLLWRALRDGMTRRGAVAVAFLGSLAYAASDEYHQTFVDGRHGTPVDVAIDAAGMAIAALLVTRRTR
ncbi:MAG TPA: VanZ family protein [Thermoleophilaceae bacterium]